MSSEIPTPFGTFQSAPLSADNQTVILWVVSVLVVMLIVAVAILYKSMLTNADRCRQENLEAKLAAKAAQDKTENLYQAALTDLGDREARLVEVVTRNTDALNAIRETFGSGYYRAISDERKKSADQALAARVERMKADDAARGPRRRPTEHGG